MSDRYWSSLINQIFNLVIAHLNMFLKKARVILDLYIKYDMIFIKIYNDIYFIIICKLTEMHGCRKPVI